MKNKLKKILLSVLSIGTVTGATTLTASCGTQELTSERIKSVLGDYDFGITIPPTNTLNYVRTKGSLYKIMPTIVQGLWKSGPAVELRNQLQLPGFAYIKLSENPGTKIVPNENYDTTFRDENYMFAVSDNGTFNGNAAPGQSMAFSENSNGAINGFYINLNGVQSWKGEVDQKFKRVITTNDYIDYIKYVMDISTGSEHLREIRELRIKGLEDLYQAQIQYQQKFSKTYKYPFGKDIYASDGKLYSSDKYTENSKINIYNINSADSSKPKIYDIEKSNQINTYWPKMQPSSLQKDEETILTKIRQSAIAFLTEGMITYSGDSWFGEHQDFWTFTGNQYKTASSISITNTLKGIKSNFENNITELENMQPPGTDLAAWIDTTINEDKYKTIKESLIRETPGAIENFKTAKTLIDNIIQNVSLFSNDLILSLNTTKDIFNRIQDLLKNVTNPATTDLETKLQTAQSKVDAATTAYNAQLTPVINDLLHKINEAEINVQKAELTYNAFPLMPDGSRYPLALIPLNKAKDALKALEDQLITYSKFNEAKTELDNANDALSAVQKTMEGNPLSKFKLIIQKTISNISDAITLITNEKTKVESDLAKEFQIRAENRSKHLAMHFDESQLSAPGPFFDSSYVLLPINKEFVESVGGIYDFGIDLKSFIYSSPFNITDLSLGQGGFMILEKDYNWFSSKTVIPDKIKIYFQTDPNIIAAMFQDGYISAADIPNIYQNLFWSQKDFRQYMIKRTGYGTLSLQMNINPNEDSPLNNENFREALSHSINRADLLKLINWGASFPVSTWTPTILIQNSEGVFIDMFFDSELYSDPHAKELGLKDFPISSISWAEHQSKNTVFENTDRNDPKFSPELAQRYFEEFQKETGQSKVNLTFLSFDDSSERAGMGIRSLLNDVFGGKINIEVKKLPPGTYQTFIKEGKFDLVMSNFDEYGKQSDSYMKHLLFPDLVNLAQNKIDGYDNNPTGGWTFYQWFTDKFGKIDTSSFKTPESLYQEIFNNHKDILTFAKERLLLNVRYTGAIPSSFNNDENYLKTLLWLISTKDTIEENGLLSHNPELQSRFDDIFTLKNSFINGDENKLFKFVAILEKIIALSAPIIPINEVDNAWMIRRLYGIQDIYTMNLEFAYDVLNKPKPTLPGKEALQ